MPRMCLMVLKPSQGGGDRPPPAKEPGGSAKHSAKSAKIFIAGR